MIARRSLLRGAVAGALTGALPRSARAAPRTPYGGRLALHAPWPLGSIDPHRIDDPGAAFFGDALFGTLYARDDTGALVPSLAEGDPEPDGAALRVTLRSGLRFASGAALDPHAVAASLARARSADAAAWLADVPSPRAGRDSLTFAVREPRRLVRALASPLASIVAPRFSPDRPDGSGPFRAEFQPGTLVLARNPLAAEGPPFLDAVEARHAGDLATSLRAFESGADDIGWLGSFLHEPRHGARSFDAGLVGWAILRTGREAGSLDVPGAAQSLADGVPHAALASLVVGAPWPQQGPAQWTGPSCELLVRDDAPWLIEVARAVAVALSIPSHEVTPRALPWSDVLQRRSQRAYALMIDFVRPAGPGPLGPAIGLATADDPSSAVALARHPPRGEVSVRTVTRTMRAGVLGEVRLQGGRAADVIVPTSSWGAGVAWGACSRLRP